MELGAESAHSHILIHPYRIGLVIRHAIEAVGFGGNPTSPQNHLRLPVSYETSYITMAASILPRRKAVRRGNRRALVESGGEAIAGD